MPSYQNKNYTPLQIKERIFVDIVKFKLIKA